MFFTPSSYKLGVLLLLLAVASSCVKDVDLSRSEQITLTPDVQLDLLIFDVDQEDFIDKDTDLFTPVIRDTVRLEFLDDDYVQENLQQLELKYKYKNSFTQAFYSKVSFLSENDQVQRSTEFYIEPGTKNNPSITEKIDFIPIENIKTIKKSIKMAVEIEVQPNSDPFVGELKFQAKGLFSFEF